MREICNCSFGRMYIPENSTVFCKNQNVAHLYSSCQAKVLHDVKKSKICVHQDQAYDETQFEATTMKSQWPEVHDFWKLINKLVLNYDYNVSNINFTPKDLQINKNELSRIPLYNLVSVLDFDENEIINITYLRTSIEKLLTNKVTGPRRGLVSKTIERLEDWAKSCLSKVTIKVGHTPVVVHEQKPQLQKSDLMAAIGGSLGLWIGWSALTLVEFVSLLSEFWRCCSRRGIGSME